MYDTVVSGTYECKCGFYVNKVDIFALVIFYQLQI